MSVRVQVVLDQDEAARFKSQALRESKSLSGWLRDAGRRMLEQSKKGEPLVYAEDLRQFFKQCDAGESGEEPGWEEHKRLIIEGFRKAGRP